MFSDESNPNNSNSNNDSKNNDTKHSDINAKFNDRLILEAQNQKSLVRATGKNKSLVPYIAQVLIVPVQKPLFPGFQSLLQIKDETLKVHFMKQYREKMKSVMNKNNKNENCEWIGLFLNNPKQAVADHVDDDDVDNSFVNEIDNENDIDDTNDSNNMEANATTNDNSKIEENGLFFHPALDEVNADLWHYSDNACKDVDEVFDYGTLVKVDFNDKNTNISEFCAMEDDELNLNNKNDELNVTGENSNNKKDSNSKKKSQWAPRSFQDPLVLKVIGARRIKINSISNHQPMMYANVTHLQPEMSVKSNELNDVENASINNNEDTQKTNSNAETVVESTNNNNSNLETKDYFINSSQSEIQCREAFNIAADLLRRLSHDDPDNRRDMMTLWAARHAIDLGFFTDFAGSATNSTPRELQKLLECVDYGERLKILITLLKREEKMLKERNNIMNHVDALIKKEDESQYLQMILHVTQQKMRQNAVQRGQLNGAHGQRGGGGGGGPFVDSDDTMENMQNNVKKDRYQRLAKKFMDKIEGKRLHPEAQEVFDEGIEKLLSAKSEQNASLEFEQTKKYLDWISSLPWNYYSIDNADIAKARSMLDEDHFGMKTVKERILEVIACNILRGDLNLNEKYGGDGDIDDSDDKMKNNNDEVNNSKILCLVGPPGVGKTSIGSSIAKALHRKFYKFSLGGNDDSHMLKGFLRTYAGSQPGKIVYGLKQCGTGNPMILIDEIDKLGARHSNPSHALLEILDPAQNHAFSDNYLDFPIDLSKVLFVCTANDAGKIDPILRDRLHLIELSGYDEHEKLEIAKKHLIPNALIKSGLTANNINLDDRVIHELVRWYCRESGVRSLSKNIEKICAKAALELAEKGITYDDIHNALNNNAIINENAHGINNNGDDADADNDGNKNNNVVSQIINKLSKCVSNLSTNHESDSKCEDADQVSSDINDNPNTHEIPFVSIDVANLKKYVGLRKYSSDRTYEDDKSTPPGVITGLAYTTNGGCITYVETTKFKSNNSSKASGTIKATGQLGKVMGESVEIAQSVARAILSNELDENNTFFDDYNVHLHCPEGAIQKDGPSAGITMVTALLSLSLNCTISPNIAMTGEVTLTGKILKIGGLKEKLLAAKRANIDTIILPFENYDDFYDDESGVPAYVRDVFKDVHFVKHYDEVTQILFSKHFNSNKHTNSKEKLLI